MPGKNTGNPFYTWYVLVQLSVIPPDRYDSVRFGYRTADEIIREAVLELTCTVPPTTWRRLPSMGGISIKPVL